MAKQTFTIGQVLTAAQMTSLQQTAMLGGAASAKTASYTLVAADAGTAISMSNASATTITVNTALFAAGDTVQITNLGVGVCTITAGTATVNTSSSLELAQYESGTLDFTSTSAAIFIKGAGAVASGGGMTLISTTALSGSSTTISSIPATYNDLFVVVRNYRPNTNATNLLLRINGDSGANRHGASTTIGNQYNGDFNDTSVLICVEQNSSTTQSLFTVSIPDYKNTTTYKKFLYDSVITSNFNTAKWHSSFGRGFYNQLDAISSLVFLPSGGTFTSGDVLLYGVK
jgi:hypothetical protein